MIARIDQVEESNCVLNEENFGEYKAACETAIANGKDTFEFHGTLVDVEFAVFTILFIEQKA
jgi:hypothetical protein